MSAKTENIILGVAVVGLGYAVFRSMGGKINLGGTQPAAQPAGSFAPYVPYNGVQQGGQGFDWKNPGNWMPIKDLVSDLFDWGSGSGTAVGGSDSPVPMVGDIVGDAVSDYYGSGGGQDSVVKVPGGYW